MRRPGLGEEIWVRLALPYSLILELYLSPLVPHHHQDPGVPGSRPSSLRQEHISESFFSGRQKLGTVRRSKSKRQENKSLLGFFFCLVLGLFLCGRCGSSLPVLD